MTTSQCPERDENGNRCVRHAQLSDLHVHERTDGTIWTSSAIASTPFTPEMLGELLSPRSINDERRSRGMPELPMTITGSALHPTQVRAYALIAASNMLGSSVGFHPHPGNVADWEGRVLKSAAHFVDFINKGTTEESEAASS